MTRLRLVATTAQAGKPPKTATQKVDYLECGCGSRDAMEILTGATVSRGKVTGGLRQWVCAACYSRGVRVVLL